MGERVRRAADDRVAARVWDHDPTLWQGTAETPELTDRLGWLTIADRQEAERGSLEAWAADVRARGLTDAVLLGMGGSSLGPEVIRRSFGLALHVLDSTDPEAVRAVGDAVDLDKTMFVVSSKSGGTVETRSHLEHFWELTGGAGAQFAAVTDPGSPLDELRARARLRPRVRTATPRSAGATRSSPPSASCPPRWPAPRSPSLLRGAIEAASRSHDERDNRRPVARPRARRARAPRPRQAHVRRLAADRLVRPVGRAARGREHGQAGPRDPARRRRAARRRPRSTAPTASSSTCAATRPTTRRSPPWPPPGTRCSPCTPRAPPTSGALFFGAEFATAVAGAVLEINPFDQPNVQQAKDATNAALESGETEVEPGRRRAARAARRHVASRLHLACTATWPRPTRSTTLSPCCARRSAARTKATTTFGYGPRFLHSTGQLHKGGPPVGVFVQFMHDAGDDVEIPGKPFTLPHAQARAGGRRPEDPARPRAPRRAPGAATAIPPPRCAT